MLACLALATPRALAADAVAAAPATAAAATPKSANADDAAAVAFSRALQQHAAGDLEGARTSMLESYRLSNRAELLYNIGKIQSALGECALALAAYRDYLERVPDGRYRAEALQARTDLEAQCPSADKSAVAAPAPAASTMLAAPPLWPSATDGEQQPRGASAATGPTKPDAVTPAANRAATVRWIGWSAIAAGALAGGGAVYFTVRTHDAHARFQENINRAVRGEVAFDQSLQDEQDRNQRWAQVLGVTGGVLLVGGTLALLFGTEPSKPVRTSVDVQVLPGAVAASYRASF